PRREVRAGRRALLVHLLGIQRLTVVDLDQHLVLELERRLDLLSQNLLVEHVLYPHAGSCDLVLVAGADPAPGRTDPAAAEIAFADLVDRHVVRHDQMRVGGEQQTRGVDAAFLQPADLLLQHPRVDDHTVADDVGHARREDPGGNQVQREILPVLQNNGMAGVVAAMVTRNPLCAVTEQISGFAVALVTPLGTDEHDRGHGTLQTVRQYKDNIGRGTSHRQWWSDRYGGAATGA